MEQELIGNISTEKTCSICKLILDLKFFTYTKFLKKDKSIVLHYSSYCKMCNNEKRRIINLDGKYYADRMRDRNINSICFGNKSESYWELEDGIQISLNKLLSLKFNDLSKNEIKFYNKYEFRNRKFSLSRNNKFSNNVNGCSSSKKRIRRSTKNILLSKKIKNRNRSMFDRFA